MPSSSGYFAGVLAYGWNSPTRADNGRFLNSATVTLTTEQPQFAMYTANQSFSASYLGAGVSTAAVAPGLTQITLYTVTTTAGPPPYTITSITLTPVAWTSPAASTNVLTPSGIGWGAIDSSSSQGNTYQVVAGQVYAIGIMQLLGTTMCILRGNGLLNNVNATSPITSWQYTTGMSTTTTASGTMPQATVPVTSTARFSPSGGSALMVCGTTWQTFSYTGISGGVNLTGCSGGVGVFTNGTKVTSAYPGGILGAFSVNSFVPYAAISQYNA